MDDRVNLGHSVVSQEFDEGEESVGVSRRGSGLGSHINEDTSSHGRGGRPVGVVVPVPVVLDCVQVR